jgi:hypothetical protein
VVTEVETEIPVGETGPPKVQDALTLFPFLVHATGKLVNGALRPAARSVQVKEITRVDNTGRNSLLKECSDILYRARVMLRDVSIRDKGYRVGVLSIVLQLRSFEKFDQTCGLIVGNLVIGDFVAVLVLNGYRLGIA